MTLRLASVTAQRTEELSVELGPRCVVQSIEVSADQGATATFALQDQTTAVVAGESKLFEGLRGHLPAHTRIRSGTVRIVYDDGETPR